MIALNKFHYNYYMKQIAIIAPTASGKTSLCIDIAHKTNSIILSLDSLAVYKEIDIASAKPTIKQRDGIVHFGIDEIYPNEHFDVMEFIELYKKTYSYAKEHDKNIIIVGGTGFYLKAMIDGISYIPPISIENKIIVQSKMLDLQNTYNFLNNLDPSFMKDIASTDKYRIEKALSIYTQTNQIPTEYFLDNPPTPIIKDIQLYDIHWEVDALRKRIAQRTQNMVDEGIITEVIYLEKKYTRKPNCMNTIGISETLDYLDGKLSKQQLIEQITTNTARLAKRQRTFNKGQFKNIVKKDLSYFQNTYKW